MITLAELQVAADSSESQASKELESWLMRDGFVRLLLSEDEFSIVHDLQMKIDHFMQDTKNAKKNQSYSDAEPHYASDLKARQTATSFTIIRDEADWPSRDIKRAVSIYMNFLDHLPIRPALSRILGRHYDVSPDFLDLYADMGKSNRVLRCMHYPLQMQRRHNLIGIAAHTDYELYTLIQESRSGLEIYSPQSNEWCSTWHPEPHLVLLLGDAFRQLTDNLFSAAEHRVPALTTSPPRSSLVFFQPLNDDYLLAPLQLRESSPHDCTSVQQRPKRRRRNKNNSTHSMITTAACKRRTQLEHIMQRDAMAKRRRADLGLGGYRI